MKRYEETLARNEFRWGEPQSKSVVDRTIATLQKAEVDGWVCSGVDHCCTPLFPSRVYPASHPKANRAWLEYLLRRADTKGIAVVSWYALNMAKPVVEKYPDYRMQFLDWSYPSDPALMESSARHFACLNSPYLDLLARFSQELIRLGFKGIWFDGNTMALHGSGPTFQPGCRCRYCVESFRKATGETLPMAVDFNNPVFKQWLVWRYTILERAWARLSAAVKSVNPDATVCLNNYRRRGLNWTTGIPLKELKQDLLMSGELDAFMAQADFQMKMHEAMQCRRGQETWIPMTHYWDLWRSNPEPETMFQGALGAVSSGGNVFCGTDNLATIRGSMPGIVQRVKPFWKYRGGQRLRYAAIWASQRSMDFDGQMDVSRYWNLVHGANELLNHAHLQSGVVFDDAVEANRLRDYPVLIGGENPCVSNRQWKNLLAYVRNGGLLVVSGRFASKDEWGVPRKGNPLHRLFGFSRVEETPGIMAYGSFHSQCRWDNYPEMIFAGGGGFQRIMEYKLSPGTTVLGWAQMKREKDDSPGILLKRCGRGWMLYLNTDLFGLYATSPVRYHMELIRRIVTRCCPPRAKITAPMAVTVNIFEKRDEFVVHFHNNPGAVYRYPHGFSAQGEVPPALDVRCDVASLEPRLATVARTGRVIPLDKGVFTLDRVNDYEVILLRR